MGSIKLLLGNAASYRTRGGVIWRDTQLFGILNRFKHDGSWKLKPKPENQWGKVDCEPIVPETLWNQVNQIIEEQSKGRQGPGKAPVQLFGGLLHCFCGHKMYVSARFPKYFCRKCANKIPVEDLEEIFHQEMKALFAQPERIARGIDTSGVDPHRL